MATTTKDYTGDGSKGIAGQAQLTFAFDYLKTEDIKVSLNGATLATTKYTFPTATSIQFNALGGSPTTLETNTQENTGAPKTGVKILIYRDTDVDAAKARFAAGSSIRSKDLNDNKEQDLFFQQEVQDPANPKNKPTSLNGTGAPDQGLGKEGDVYIDTTNNAIYGPKTNGAWGSATTLAGVLGVTGTAPITSSGGDSPVIGISAATTSAAGSMSAADKTKLDGIESGATADQTDAEIKTAYENNSDTNAFTDAEKTKLSGIETGATADQTAAEIRTLVDSASDSNVFTDADHTKLDGIESNATADQTDAEIRAAVEAASDSNVFTDADHTKLNGIEASATADQTGAEIKSLYEGESDTNAFTDSEKTKLSGIETNATADQTDAEIRAAVEAATDSNVFTDADHTKLNGIETGATADQTGAEIKSAYEGESDTNAFTDAEKTKLSGIEANADVTDEFNVTAAMESFSNSVIIPDNIAIRFGNDSNLRIFHNANDDWSYIKETDDEVQGLRIQGQNLVLEDNAGDNYVLCEHDGPVSLYHDAASKLMTRSYGVEIRGDGSSQDGTIQLNCSQNSHGVKIQSPPHSANASYTLTLPNTDGNANQVLKSDGSGNLDWVDQTTAYTDSSVDSHLNTSTASSNEVLSWNGSDYAWVAQSGGGGGSAITVQDEGSALSTAATTLNFVGAGVTATGSGATKTITISGGGGSGSGISQAKATALSLIL